jgi:hypothetical protein
LRNAGEGVAAGEGDHQVLPGGSHHRPEYQRKGYAGTSIGTFDFVRYLAGRYGIDIIKVAWVSFDCLVVGRCWAASGIAIKFT